MKPLTPQLQRRLAARARRGNRSTRELLFNRMRWVISTARASLHAPWEHREDLDQLGAVALLEVIDAYNPAGVRDLAAVAFTRVRGEMSEYLLRERLRGGRLPVAGLVSFLRVKRLVERRGDLRVPGVDEILAGLDMPSALALLPRDRQAEHLEAVLRVLQGVDSLDRQLSEDEGGDALGELLADPQESVEEVAVRRVLADERRAALRRALKHLTRHRRRAVLGILAAGGAWTWNGGALTALADRLGVNRDTLGKHCKLGMRDLRERYPFLREYYP